MNNSITLYLIFPIPSFLSLMINIYSVEHLEEATMYFFRVAAANSVGYGEYSAVANLTTAPGTEATYKLCD